MYFYVKKFGSINFFAYICSENLVHIEWKIYAKNAL